MDLPKNVRRHRKPTKKRSEHSKNISDARNRFLNAHKITPEFYAAHEIYMKGIQKHVERLCPRLNQHEFVNVKILQSNSPKELYVMKTTDIQLADEFQHQLTKEYTCTRHQYVYYLKEGVICVAFSKHGWQRCRIIRLHENGMCDALLIDIGIIERIDWYDLRTIDGVFRPQVTRCSLIDFSPLAIPCSLVSITTAHRIERFSLEQYRAFQEMLQYQHDFYVYTHRADVISDIFLYYKYDDQFYCINDLFPSGLASGGSSSEMSVLPVKSTTIGMDSTTNSPKTTHSQAVNKTNMVILSDESNKTNESNGMAKDSVETKLDDEDATKQDALLRISKPEKIIIRNVVGIDEIYICYSRYLEAFERFSHDIQKSVMARSAEEKNQLKKTQWQINSDCLAINPYNPIKEWARGRIVAFNGSTTCLVYLRDYGKTIECRMGDLEAIKKKFRIVNDMTWKVQLSSIKMNKSCSPISVNELLCDMIGDDMAISVVDIKTGNECSVILWAIQIMSSALLPDKIEYININDELVKSGLVTAIVSFDGISNVVNAPSPDINFEPIDTDFQFIQGINCSTVYDSNGNQVKRVQTYRKVTDEANDVKCWLPAEQIDNGKFVAFPMHVSQNLIIYVLEANRKTVADEIEIILECKYRAKQLVRRNAIEWKQGDACFARFGFDKFYRATVRRVNFAKNSCVVRFIDYGNCESLRLDDLRKATMFGDIPILSQQFQLHNIRSARDDGLWPVIVQKFCMHLIIERHCDLEIIDMQSSDGNESSQVSTCRLKLLNKYKDLALALVSHGYAKFIAEPSDDPVSI